MLFWQYPYHKKWHFINWGVQVVTLCILPIINVLLVFNQEISFNLIWKTYGVNNILHHYLSSFLIKHELHSKLTSFFFFFFIPAKLGSGVSATGKVPSYQCTFISWNISFSFINKKLFLNSNNNWAAAESTW